MILIKLCYPHGDPSIAMRFFIGRRQKPGTSIQHFKELLPFYLLPILISTTNIAGIAADWLKFVTVSAKTWDGPPG